MRGCVWGRIAFKHPKSALNSSFVPESRADARCLCRSRSERAAWEARMSELYNTTVNLLDGNGAVAAELDSYIAGNVSANVFVTPLWRRGKRAFSGRCVPLRSSGTRVHLASSVM